MRSFDNQPILRKSLSAPIAVLLLMAALIALEFFSLAKTRFEVRDLQARALPRQAALLQIRDEMTTQQLRVFRFVSWSANGVKGAAVDNLAKEIADTDQRVTARIRNFDRSALSEGDAQVFKKLEPAWTDYATSAERAVAVADGDPNSGSIMLGICDDNFIVASALAARLIESATDSTVATAGASLTPSPTMATRRPSLRNRCTTSLLRSGKTPASTSSIPSLVATARAVDAMAAAQSVMLLLFGALAVALGMAAATLAARSISRPLQVLTRTMSVMTQGDLEATIAGTQRRDEIGVMARALEVFKASLVERRQMESDTQAARERLDRERAEAERAAIEAERRLVCDTIGAALGRLAAKDLAFRMYHELPGAYAQLKADFNRAAGEMQTAMNTVAESILAISSGAGEMASAASELSGRTEAQAAGLEQTSAALTAITHAGEKAAQGAAQARNLVTAATSDAGRAADVVRSTVEAMAQIDESARKIDQIIGVIDVIAFQTNLLALNAGIEAARAGEAGRGFAVVAAEVRALALRTGEAAREIKTLISTSSGQVASGVQLVQTTGEVLTHLLHKVEEVKQVVVAIASGAQDQATGLSEVNAALTQMDNMTQQNAAMVEETHGLSRTLSDEGRRLTDLVGHFNLDEAARKAA